MVIAMIDAVRRGIGAVAMTDVEGVTSDVARRAIGIRHTVADATPEAGRVTAIGRGMTTAAARAATSGW